MSSNFIAPICLFTYNRLSETRETVEALRRNYLASASNLFIFSDGPKNKESKLKVEAVRQYLHTITGFQSIEIIESPINKGLANSIIEGVNLIINQFGKAIVLEDDLISSANFLNFMNQALITFENKKNIFSISGYTIDLPSLEEYSKDYYLGHRASSWGWATWQDRWLAVDWKVESYNTFQWDPVNQIKFMRGGADLPYMLWKQMNGKIDSWAVRWCFDQFKKDMLTVFPKRSKIINIGFGADATHTKMTSRYKTTLDETGMDTFIFDSSTQVDKKLVKEFNQNFSIYKTLKEKIKVSFAP